MFRKGQAAWNKGLKGVQIAWNKGLTKETDKRIGQMARTNSISHKGQVPWNKGLNRHIDERIKGGKVKNKRDAIASYDELFDMYWNKEYSLNEIADRYSVNSGTIWYRMRDLGISIRSRKEANNIKSCKEKRSASWKRNWRDEKFVAEFISKRNTIPTKPEMKIISICDKYFPQFEYNGDFSQGVALDGMIPDFINTNGKKQVIEIFGDYWHSSDVIGDDWRSSELGRIMAYNSLGYECLILWEHDMNSKSEEQLIEQIKTFTKRR